MACEDEKANLELLELLSEMAFDDWSYADLDTFHAFDSFGRNCGEHLFDESQFPSKNYMEILTLALVKFLDDLDRGSVTAECESALQNLLDTWRERQAKLQWDRHLREAVREAKDRYNDCLHKQKAGAPNS